MHFQEADVPLKLKASGHAALRHSQAGPAALCMTQLPVGYLPALKARVPFVALGAQPTVVMHRSRRRKVQTAILERGSGRRV